MGLDMSLYIRKKDYKNKIPMEALKNYGDIEDIDNTEEFIKKVGTIKLAELIMSKNVFVDQEYYTDTTWLSILKSIGYWRKANAIHNWFVKNVQHGEDDCGYYVVTKGQLEELKDTCQKVLETLNDDEMEEVINEDGFKVMQYKNRELAQELLPTQEGFFFGGTSYTEYYKEQLQNTIRICNSCWYVKEDFEILYHSSW